MENSETLQTQSPALFCYRWQRLNSWRVREQSQHHFCLNVQPPRKTTAPHFLHKDNHCVSLNSYQTRGIERKTPGWSICKDSREQKSLTLLPATHDVMHKHWSCWWCPANIRISGAFPPFSVSILKLQLQLWMQRSFSHLHTCLRHKPYPPSSIAQMTDTHPRHLGCGICMRFTCFLKVYAFLLTYIFSEFYYFFQGNKCLAFPVHLEHATYFPKAAHLHWSKQHIWTLKLFFTKKRNLSRAQHLQQTGSLLMIWASKR